MSYEVRLARQAETELRRADGRLQERLLARLEQLAIDPFGPASKPLTNAAGRRSARVGDYRIIFRVDGERHVVEVSAIGPRGRIYRHL